MSIEAVKSELNFDPDALRAKYREERDKRLRDDGIAQYHAPEADFKHFEEDPYVEEVIEREPLSDQVDVLVIGGGFGGILTAIHLRKQGVKDIRIVEKGSAFGGVWYWNRYPGAACDVEAYVYLPLLEESGFVPPKRFIEGKDIREYFDLLANKYDLYDNALLQTEVTEVNWLEDKDRWCVETSRGDKIEARYVAHTNGTLSRPKLPGIPGIEKFEGHTFHTSRWDYGYTGGTADGGLTGLADKKVGIIGTGATSIQCVPHLAEGAEHLYVFQRTPSSVDVRLDRETDKDWFLNQPEGWHKARRENFNALLSGIPLDEDLVEDGWTQVGATVSTLLKAAGPDAGVENMAELAEIADFMKMEELRSRVDDLVDDPETANALKPWFRQFCKRPTSHESYLQTFNRDNVTLVDTDGKGVTEITENAVIVDGQAYEVDCLIFSTGFEVGTVYTSRSGYDVIGRDGLRLSEKWGDGVSSLHGMSSRGFPNCHFMSNFQSGFTLNFTHALEEEAQHIAYLVSYGLTHQLRRLEPSQEGEENWVKVIEEKAGLADDFLDSCTPGYYNDEGKVRERSRRNSWYGGTSIEFFALLNAWREAGDLSGMELVN
ncbi:penE [Symbiodinium microadriaticum]|nr:penE [Symbiodinium microadriaticum]